MTTTLLRQALDALEESVDLVQHDYDTDWRHGMPTRKLQLDAALTALTAHRAAIDAIREHLAWPEPSGKVLTLADSLADLAGTERPAQPQPKPVAWAMPRPDGLVLDVITPEEHERHEGEYTEALCKCAAQPEQCYCDRMKIGVPGVSCGDCPRDYRAAQPAPAEPVAGKPCEYNGGTCTRRSCLAGHQCHATMLAAAQPAPVPVPLTDGLVAHLEQQAFASTNYTPERPLYQHWFRVGVRAGYGIAASPEKP